MQFERHLAELESVVWLYVCVIVVVFKDLFNKKNICYRMIFQQMLSYFSLEEILFLLQDTSAKIKVDLTQVTSRIAIALTCFKFFRSF